MDEFDRLLRDARPSDPTRSPGVLAALDELQARTRRRATRWKPWRRAARRTQRVLAVTGLAVLAGTGVASATVAAARTGWFTPATSEQNTTEWLDSSAPDFESVVDDLAPAYVTYPPTVDRNAASDWVADAMVDSGGLVQETSVVRAYETFAQCSWVRAWQDSTSSAEALEAADQITASVSWPAFAASDGGGVVEAMKQLADAARRGDAASVAAQAAIVCPPSLVDSR